MPTTTTAPSPLQPAAADRSDRGGIALAAAYAAAELAAALVFGRLFESGRAEAWPFLAQPQRLAPAELAALDTWVRGGGAAVILADPMLAWPSRLPPGDIRRPPPFTPLGPLLAHWGMRVEAASSPTQAG